MRCRLAPVSSRQSLTSEAYHGKLTTSTWQGGLRAVLGPWAPVYGEAASAALITSFTRHTPQARHATCRLAGIGSWVVRAGRPDSHEPVYRRHPPPVAGPGGRPRPRLTASISPEARLVGHEHRNAVKHVLPGLFRTPLPSGPGRARPQGGAPSGNAWRQSRPQDRAARAGCWRPRPPPAAQRERAGLRPPRTGLAAACPAGSPPSFEAVSVPVKDPSPGLGSRSAMALVSSSR